MTPCSPSPLVTSPSWFTWWLNFWSFHYDIQSKRWDRDHLFLIPSPINWQIGNESKTLFNLLLCYLFLICVSQDYVRHFSYRKHPKTPEFDPWMFLLFQVSVIFERKRVSISLWCIFIKQKYSSGERSYYDFPVSNWCFIFDM